MNYQASNPENLSETKMKSSSPAAATAKKRAQGRIQILIKGVASSIHIEMCEVGTVTRLE